MGNTGREPVELRPVTTPDDLPQEGQRVVYGLWKSVFDESEGVAPSRDAFDIAEIQAYLANVSLVDILDGGEDFRIRVFGTELVRIQGRDLTGFRVSELESENRYGILAAFRTVTQTVKPHYARTLALDSSHAAEYDRLSLPFSKDGKTPDQILALNYPAAMRTPLPNSYLA